MRHHSRRLQTGLVLTVSLVAMTATSCAPATSGDITACELVTEEYATMSDASVLGAQSSSDSDVWKEQIKSAQDNLSRNFETAVDRADDSELISDMLSARDSMQRMDSSDDAGIAFFMAMDRIVQRCADEHGVEVEILDASQAVPDEPDPSPDQPASESPEEPVEYPEEYVSIFQMQEAYESVAGECRRWDFDPNKSFGYSNLAGYCDDAVLSIYSNPEDLESQLNLAKGYDYDADESPEWLVGKNWVVNAGGLEELQEAMGGEIVSLTD